MTGRGPSSCLINDALCDSGKYPRPSTAAIMVFELSGDYLIVLPLVAWASLSEMKRMHQLLDDERDRGANPRSSRSAQLSVPADRRGRGTAQVGTPRRGKIHTCKPHQRARTPTRMSQSTTGDLRSCLYEPTPEAWVPASRTVTADS